MNFDSVEKVAAAILYEGYILYPYRATAVKNRQRWNFGTLYPRVYAEAQRPREPFGFVSECLVRATEGATLALRIRFLQLMPPKSLESAGLIDPALCWNEGVERTGELRDIQLGQMSGETIRRDWNFDLSGSSLQAQLTILMEGNKLRIELENTSSVACGSVATRAQALPYCFASAHLLLGISGGEFISLLDPPPEFATAAAACRNTGVFPVLVGDEPDKSMMLCAPIILYDYPRIAPESAGDFFDGTEMDEMLTLRVLTLTDAEKKQMREGDPRARHILERTEALTAESMLRAHGVVRAMRDVQEDTA